MRRLRQAVAGKPHIFKWEGAYDCGMQGTIRGFGYTPAHAYADWRQINIEKGRIVDDPAIWPLPRARDDRGGSPR